jgi:peptidoglycan hydrolase-like protein with peptidoglycan-binding domain
MFHRGVFLALASITTLGMAPIAWGQDGDYLDAPRQLAQQVEDFTIPTETPEAPAPSEDVGALQQRLLELGYYTGEIDGIFNPETREALSDFQQQVGLARTGILDPLTRQQLGARPCWRDP